MKKALCLFLAAALTLTLWACGAPETAIQKLESPPAAQDAESAPAAELPDEPPEEAAAPVQEAEPESAAEEALPEELPAEPEPEPAAEEALPEEPPAEPAAAEEIVEEAAEPAAPEPLPAEAEPPAADAAGESASDHAGHSQSSAGVTVPAPEQGENLVWIPTNGGTNYHTSAKCCNMKNPIQVTLETALANGFTPCKRCH